MRHAFTASWFVFLVTSALAGAAAQVKPGPNDQWLHPHPRGYVAYRAAAPLVIDGRLDEADWQNAAWTDAFIDIAGDAKPRPKFDTRARMLWDDTYFYIGAELREPHVWATLTEHDAVIFRDPDFEVFIDPNGDNHEYYEFEINALGTGWDLLLPKPYKDDGKAVNGWEIAGLKSAVHVDGTLNDARDTDRGWSVELAFPWRVLGELARRPSPPRDGDQWRVNFSRVEWPINVADGRYAKVVGSREDNWVWSPQHVIDMHRPETWGYVQFSTATSDLTGASTGASTGTPAQVAFVPDRSWPARDWLHRVYYAQREYRKAHGRWALSLEELGLPTRGEFPLASGAVRVAGGLFESSVDLRLGNGPAERWVIRQDSLIWREAR